MTDWQPLSLLDNKNNNISSRTFIESGMTTYGSATQQALGSLHFFGEGWDGMKGIDE
jgi:hypothetical protein